MKKDVKKLNTTRLFLCKTIQTVQNVYPAERQAEIDGCANPIVKAEKYTSWQLLRYAIEHTFDLPFEQLNLHKNANGKWTCDELCFSISHSNGLCAVVVDKNLVGVDIQAFEPHRFDHRLLARIVCEQEKQVTPYKTLLATTTEQLTEQQQKQILSLWCKKEALFKRLDLSAFVAHNVNTATAHFVEMDVDENGNVIAQAPMQNVVQQTTEMQSTITTSTQPNDAKETTTTQNDTFYHIAIATDSTNVAPTWVEME